MFFSIIYRLIFISAKGQTFNVISPQSMEVNMKLIPNDTSQTWGDTLFDHSSVI